MNELHDKDIENASDRLTFKEMIDDMLDKTEYDLGTTPKDDPIKIHYLRGYRKALIHVKELLK